MSNNSNAASESQSNEPLQIIHNQTRQSIRRQRIHSDQKNHHGKGICQGPTN